MNPTHPLPPEEEGRKRKENKRPDAETRSDDEERTHTEKELDHGLKETFPASDPVSINPGAD